MYDGHPHVNPVPPQPQNKSNKRAFILVGVIVGIIVGLLLCFGACSVFFAAGDNMAKEAGLSEGIATAEEPTNDPSADVTAPPAQNTTAKVGETLIVDGNATEKWTLVKTEQKATNQWGDKAQKGTYLLVSMKVQVTEGSSFICSCSLQFIGPDNQVYDPSYASMAKRPDLPSTDLGPGQKTNGWVVFDLPKSALKNGRVQLKPNSWEDVYGYWAL